MRTGTTGMAIGSARSLRLGASVVGDATATVTTSANWPGMKLGWSVVAIDYARHGGLDNEQPHKQERPSLPSRQSLARQILC
jgi:hypothetical protein